MPGYCGGISLGNWQNLNELLENGINLEDYPILRHLIVNDMEGLFRFAMDFGYVESQNGYLSKCDLCLDIRKHLIAKHKFDELNLKDFYIHS